MAKVFSLKTYYGLSSIGRRAFLAVPGYYLAAGQLAKALKYLVDREYLVARVCPMPESGRRVSVADGYGVARELQGAYARCRAADRTRMVDELVGLIVDDEIQRTGMYSLDNVHAWFAYQTGQDLYRAVLERLQQLPPSSREHRTIAIKCSRQLASQLRREDRVPEALAMLLHARTLLKRQRPLDYKEIGIVGYELGMTYYLLGRDRQSLAVMRRGVEDSERAGDRVGAIITGSRLVVNELYCGVLAPSGAIARLEAFRSTLLTTEAHHPAAERWVMNATAHLCDAAFVGGDRCALAGYMAQLRVDRWLEVHREEPSAQMILAGREARLASLEEEWGHAVTWFASYLDVELPRGQKPRERIARATPLEDLSLEYLHAGVALEQLGEAVKARAAWQKGLACPDNMGNRRWKEMIHKRIADREDRRHRGPE